MGSNLGVNRQFPWLFRKKETNSSVCVSCAITGVSAHYQLFCANKRITSHLTLRETRYSSRTQSFLGFSVNFKTLLIYPQISTHGVKNTDPHPLFPVQSPGLILLMLMKMSNVYFFSLTIKNYWCNFSFRICC